MTTISDYEKNDPTFVNDLIKSKDAVSVAAQWLSNMGYPVVVRPTFIRPDASQMNEFSDSGDIEIMQRVEIKRRPDLMFKSKNDFPYKTIIVDVCHSYDKARPKPYAYIIFNANMTGAFIINVKETFPLWAKTIKQDKKKGRERAFYECPLSHVSYVDI